MPEGHSTPDSERLQRFAETLLIHHFDALVCTLPSHVLLLSAYFPVVGTSIAIATTEPRLLLIVPEDEAELAQDGYADDIITYKPSQVDRIQTVAEAATPPLQEAVRRLGIERARIGFEFGPASEPSSYSAMNLFAGAIQAMIQQAAPHAQLAPADDPLAKLAAVKTSREVERIRLSCEVAGRAFGQGSGNFRPGMSEVHAAALVRSGFAVLSPKSHCGRAEGFAWCMSGPNSAKASGAYAQSRHRELATGDLVLTHANSNLGGYWTDITRTYVLGRPDARQQELYQAIFAAREAALSAIRPGARACTVDMAARETLANRGLAAHFKHSTGHGVGFSAISANALPRIHPASQEILEQGMVFNLEPAVYFDDYGGIRHCDMVAVGENGADLLTPFQCTLEQLILPA